MDFKAKAPELFKITTPKNPLHEVTESKIGLSDFRPDMRQKVKAGLRLGQFWPKGLDFKSIPAAEPLP